MSDLLTTPPRAERQRAKRRTRRARRVSTWLLLAALAGGAAYSVAQRGRGGDDAASGGPPARLRTTLVAMRLASDPSGAADSLTVFASRTDGSEPVRLFLPSGTLAPIPGQGFEPLSRALGAGDARLLELSVENLLGLRVDRTIVVDDVSLGRMVDEAGGIRVDVPETITEIEAGVSEQVATAGVQHMDGAQALTYWTYRGGNETELTRFVRAQAVIDALATLGRDALVRAAAATDPEGATRSDDLRALAPVLALGGERVNIVTPVEPAGGSGAGELYRLDDDRADPFLRQELPGALFTLEARPRVEVRNGNGTPGIGERVAGLLVPDGFAIEVSGNAPTFTEARTRIVIYRDAPEMRALAERVRGLLGVGRVELAAREQSVVDLTIVIGRDLKGRAP